MQFDHNRRQFIALLGGAAAAWPLAARAQQPAMPVIGFMHAGVATAHTHVVAALRQGLKESGYVEGRNLAIEYRWANNENDRLPELAADLVRRQVAVIVATGGVPSAQAAKAATSTIPIVLAIGADPVRVGLVASLNRPGGNVTGVTFTTTELMAKRLDLLRELVPQAATVAYLADTRSVVGQEMLSEILVAAGVLGRQLAVAEVRSEYEFEAAFASFVERRSGALVVGARRRPAQPSRRRTPSRSSQGSWPTLWATNWSQAWGGRAVMLLGRPFSARNWSPSACSCSEMSFPGSFAWLHSGIRTRTANPRWRTS